MDTLAEIRVALNAASERLDRGLAHVDPQQFLDQLWSSVYEASPVDLQPYVWSRLVDLGQRAGLFSSGAMAASRTPPPTHYRP